MLPGHIVGSVVTARKVEPFVVHTATGTVDLGTHVPALAEQAQMGSMEHDAVKRQVRSLVADATKVVVGKFRCDGCQRWLDVVADPQSWNGARCSRC